MKGRGALQDNPLGSGGKVAYCRDFGLPAVFIVLWLVLLCLIYAWTLSRETDYAARLARIQTRTLYQQLVNFRSWNAKHRGILVERSEDTPSNPYLPPRLREVRGQDGTVFVRLNPAYMTRKLQENSASPDISFHIASLRPTMNPDNTPDAWEEQALRRSKVKPEDVFALSGDQYRFMAPLIASSACLSCHVNNQVGDILGGLSVSIPAAPILESVRLHNEDSLRGFLLIGLLGSIGIGVASWQINRKRREAESASSAKSAFLANMSHELRTPMNGILGLCGLLSHTPLSSLQHAHLNRIELSGRMLLGVINDILDFSKIEAGHMQLEKVVFRLEDVLDNVMGLARADAEKKGLALSFTVHDVRTPIVGDPLRLSQVLLNLVGNALKFTCHGSISVDVHEVFRVEDETVLRFDVRDTGIGISEDKLGLLCQPFMQADSSTARRYGGTGLGLSICKRLVGMMGGTMTIDSEENEGSCFSFTARFRLFSASGDAVSPNGGLDQDDTSCGGVETPPRSDAGRVEPEEKLEPAAVSLRGRRVLLAEDNEINQIVAMEMLRSWGVETALAGNGEEAVDMAVNGQYDLIFMDIQMPRMDGLEAVRRIRQNTSCAQVPIIAMTAQIYPEDKRSSLDAGMQDFIAKPIEPSELRKVLCRWLGRDNAAWE